MLLCFVDESNQGHFFGFAGLLADEVATDRITRSLNIIAEQAIVDWGLPGAVEIHGHEVFHGKGDWRGVPTRARVGIFHKVVGAVMREDVVVLLRGVDARRLEDRQRRRAYPVKFPPEQVCFQHILQRADDVARGRDTYALVIADDRSDRDRHRDRFATYRTEGTPGAYMRSNLDRLLDTVHFALSHRSRMLQAVDVLAFVYRRYRTVQEVDPRAAREMQRLWGLMTDSGKVHGEGMWP